MKTQSFLIFFAVLLFQASPKIYYKFPDLIKCQSTTFSDQYFIFWINDYSDTYVVYRLILNSA